MKRVIEMIAFMKHVSSKELKGFRGHSLINLNRSFIFPFDTEANISLITWLVFTHSCASIFPMFLKMAFISRASGSRR